MIVVSIHFYKHKFDVILWIICLQTSQLQNELLQNKLILAGSRYNFINYCNKQSSKHKLNLHRSTALRIIKIYFTSCFFSFELSVLVGSFSTFSSSVSLSIIAKPESWISSNTTSLLLRLHRPLQSVSYLARFLKLKLKHYLHDLITYIQWIPRRRFNIPRICADSPQYIMRSHFGKKEQQRLSLLINHYFPPNKLKNYTEVVPKLSHKSTRTNLNKVLKFVRNFNFIK